MNEEDAPITDWEESGSGSLEAPAPVVAAAAVVEPATKAAAPAVTPAAAAQADADSGTLEEHEAAEAERAEGRDERGRFKHRADSQKASPNDVPLISEYTKRIKAAEAAAGADIVRQEGESNRVFELRRRAELAERKANGEAPKPEPVPPIAAAPIAPRAPIAELYPVKAAKDDLEPDPTKYDDLTKYFKDQSLWAGREALRQANAEIAQQRAIEQHRQAEGSWQQRRAVSVTKYPDFAKVALAPVAIPGMPQITEIPAGSIIDALIWEHPQGDDLLYHLKKNPAELARLLQIQNPWEQNIELGLLTRKLAAPPAAPKPPAAASRPVSAPPRTVKTTPAPPSVTVPGDDDSLEAHEKHYYGNGSRRR